MGTGALAKSALSGYCYRNNSESVRQEMQLSMHVLADAEAFLDPARIIVFDLTWEHVHSPSQT